MKLNYLVNPGIDGYQYIVVLLKNVALEEEHLKKSSINQ